GHRDSLRKGVAALAHAARRRGAAHRLTHVVLAEQPRPARELCRVNYPPRRHGEAGVAVVAYPGRLRRNSIALVQTSGGPDVETCAAVEEEARLLTPDETILKRFPNFVR